VPIWVQALEPDVVASLFFLDEHDVLPKKAGLELPYGRRRVHLEPEMQKPRDARRSVVLAQRKGEAVRVLHDDHAIRVPASGGGSKPKYRA